MTDLKNALKPEEQLDSDVEPAPEATDTQLKRVSTLAQRQLEIKREIEDLEKQLQRKQEELKTNAESDLPEAMTSCGLQELTISGGALVTLKKVVAASIPAPKLGEAMSWLEAHNAGSLIKHTVNIEFGKGEEQLFKDFLEDLKRRQTPVKATSKDYVHPQTLGAYIREQDRNGVVVPEDVFGIFRVTKADVKPPKLSAEEV
jgi:hypothetical protein